MRSEARVLILVCHRVHNDSDPTAPRVVPGESCGHVTKSAFRTQLDVLAERGFSVVTHGEIGAWLTEGTDLPSDRNVAIDFDDNRLNVVENALPVMEEYGFSGTMFVVSGLAEGGVDDLRHYPVADWDALAKLRDAGWAIGSHTHTHRRLGDLCDPSEIEEELIVSRQLIQERLGTEVRDFAYPEGSWNEDVERIVKRHYRSARHWEEEFGLLYNTVDTNPFRLKAVNVSMLTTRKTFTDILTGLRG